MHRLEAVEQAERAHIAAVVSGDCSQEISESMLHRMSGYKRMEAKQFDTAINEFSAALKLAKDSTEEALLLWHRCDAFLGMCQTLRGIPAAVSEHEALYGLDPMALAQLALKDASKVVEMESDWPRGHLLQGAALTVLERYDDAEKAYMEALALGPTDPSLHAALKQARATFGSEPSSAPGPSTAASRPVRRAVSSDDTDCSLCMKLLYEPVTTPCGHTFCRACFARSMDHSSRCPMCRTVLHVGRQLEVTRALHNVLERSFPEEYEARRRETLEALEPPRDHTAPFPIPLFVMQCIMPGERMALNIFEPRYRLLVRRCMAGSRRFGMACIDYNNVLHEDACEAEIVECQPQPDGRYYLEVVGRRRLKISRAWELDGYRMAEAKYRADDNPAPNTPEAAQLAQLATSVEALADQWVDKVKMLARGRRGMKLLELLHRAGPKPSTADVEGFSFWCANVCPMDQADRLALLGHTRTADRLAYEKSRLESALQDGGCVLM